jgi:O-antigen/teichoic acid export membrane protein
MLGVIVVVGMGLVAFSPFATLWFRNVSGLTMELTDLSYLPLKIMVLLPALSVLLSFQRSILVIEKNTRPISIATAIELVVIIMVLIITIVYLNFIGVIAAALAFMIGKSAANIFLTPMQIRAAKVWTQNKIG